MALLARPLVLAVVLVASACGTTKGAGMKGDPEAREVERRVEELNEVLEAEDVEQATKLSARLDEYVAKHRRTLELHPEGSMMFSRLDGTKRRLRQLQKIAEEQRAAQALADSEAQVRAPLEAAAATAQEVLERDATAEDVAKLRKAIGDAQDALNDARRDKKVEVGGAFATEIEARLEALRGTADKADKVARAGEIRDQLVAARASVARSEEERQPADMLSALQEADRSYQACLEDAGKLQADAPELSRHLLAVGERKLPLKAVVKLCGKERSKLGKKVKKAEKAEKALASFQKFLADKSPDQQRIGNEWARKPNVIRKKKGKKVWIYIDKTKVKKGGRTRTVKKTHTYSFNAEGALVDEKVK